MYEGNKYIFNQTFIPAVTKLNEKRHYNNQSEVK